MSLGLRRLIAERLIALRHQAHKSQETVAAHLGMTQQGYSNYETGKRDIPFPKLVKVYDYLGGNLAELVELHVEADDEEEASFVGTL